MASTGAPFARFRLRGVKALGIPTGVFAAGFGTDPAVGHGALDAALPHSYRSTTLRSASTDLGRVGRETESSVHHHREHPGEVREDFPQHLPVSFFLGGFQVAGKRIPHFDDFVKSRWRRLNIILLILAIKHP